MDGPMLFQFIGESVDQALNAYVMVTADKVIADFFRTAVIATAMYYTITGTLMALGAIPGSMPSLVVSAGRFLLISAFALSAGMYSEWVVESIRGMETGFIAAFAGSEGIEPTSVYAVVDDAVGKGWGLSAELWERAGNHGWSELGMAFGDYINALIIAAATLIIAAPAGAMIITAKALLALMLGIGPFFVMCLMWSITRQFFDKWFGMVMMCIFQIALLGAVLSFAVRIFLAFVGPADIDSDQNPLFTSLQLLGLTFVMLWLLYQAYNVAGHLGGGVASTAITLGHMAARASGLSSAAANIINPASTRRDLESGMMVTAGRLNHLAAGNTVWNPRYTQHVLRQFGKNWGRARGGGVQGE